MSWNDNDPADDLAAALEATLEADMVAADHTGPDAPMEAATDEPHGASREPPMEAAADEPHEASREAEEPPMEAAADEPPMEAAADEPQVLTMQVASHDGGGHGGGEAPPSIPGPTEDGDNCAICQVPLRDDPDDFLADSGLRAVPLEILPCAHKFHQCCITETCRILEIPLSTLMCPTCRRTPQDIRAMEERMINEGMARRAAEGLPHRAKAAQADRARQLQIDVMFGGTVSEHAPKAHGQRCAGLDNPWHPLPPPTPSRHKRPMGALSGRGGGGGGCGGSGPAQRCDHCKAGNVVHVVEADSPIEAAVAPSAAAVPPPPQPPPGQARPRRARPSVAKSRGAPPPKVGAVNGPPAVAPAPSGPPPQAAAAAAPAPEQAAAAAEQAAAAPESQTLGRTPKYGLFQARPKPTQAPMVTNHSTFLEDLRMLCGDCGTEVEVMDKMRVRNKGKNVFRCPRCSSKVTQLTTELSGWPTPKFQALDDETKKKFFGGIRDITNRKDVVARFHEFMKGFEEHHKWYAEGGEFLPLSAWKVKGFDTDRIEGLSHEWDIRDCRVLGKTFRVPIYSAGTAGKKGKVREDVEENSGKRQKVDGAPESSSESSSSSSSSSRDRRKKKGKKDKKGHKKDKGAKKKRKEKERERDDKKLDAMKKRGGGRRT